MKTITEHLKTLPEPYSTLALRRVVAGRENKAYASLTSALMSGAFPWGNENIERDFWNRVDDYARGIRKDLPEIPVFLLAELEPAPTTPACVFEVGKEYASHDGITRKVISVDTSFSRYPVVARSPNGECSSYTLEGQFACGSPGDRDLIPPAPPKRVVPLECADVPPGSVFRLIDDPGGYDSTASVNQGGVVLANRLGHRFAWEKLQAEWEILLPNTTVWQKCEKEVDA